MEKSGYTPIEQTNTSDKVGPHQAGAKKAPHLRPAQEKHPRNID
jgi:hypothetical protein